MRYPSRMRDGLGYGDFSEAGLVVQAWKSFALIALRLPKVCDRSHKNLLRSLGGPLPAWQRLSFNPAGRSLLFWPVSALFTRGRS
jgi:hypothetical protein